MDRFDPALVERAAPWVDRACRVWFRLEVLGMEQAILSQHLTLMRDKGLLGVEKEGKYSFYHLEQPGFLKIIKDLENCCDNL